MKTRYMIAAAALLVLAGCAKEVDDVTPDVHILKAVIESGETRVSFDEMGKFSWDEGDKLAVYVGDAFEEVSVDAATGAFRIQGTGDRSFFAVYPASVAPASNAELTVTLPVSYDISAVTDGDYAPVPMVAQNVQGMDELYFLHVGGLIRIFGDVDTPASTAVVTFDKDVTGTYAVNTTNMSNPTITTAGTATNNSVTFTLPAGSTEFVLNVPVPCGTYESVSVALDDGPPVQLNTTALTIARHHGKVLQDGDVTFKYRLEGLHEVVSEYLGGNKELAQAFFSYKTHDGGATKVGVPFVIEYSETGEDGTWSDDWSAVDAPNWLSVADGVDYSGSTTGEPIHVNITSQVNTAVDEHANTLAAREPKTDFDLSTYNVATGETCTRTTANCYVVDAPGTYKFPLVYGNAIKDGAANEIAWHTKDGDNFREVDFVRGTMNELVSPNYSSKWGLKAYMVDHRDVAISYPYIMTHLANTGLTVSEYTAVVYWMDVIRNGGSGDLNGRLLVQDAAVSGSGDDAYITFSVPAESIEQGNAMITLMADGVPVWFWHIWVTDADLRALDGPDGYKFAPKNIGWRDTRETSRYDERSAYVRVRQTETGGIASEALKVTSLAGKITVESGGRDNYFLMGSMKPWTSNYYRTEGTGEPQPKSGSTYKGYGLNYLTNMADVPELQVEWDYPGYGTQSSYVNWDDPMTTSVEHLNLVAIVTLGMNIRYPGVRFSASRLNAWTNVIWRNLWDATDAYVNNSSSNYNVATSTKTVYDPSPVGYKVPPYAAFTGFTSENMPYAVVDRVYGRLYNNELFFPFAANTTKNVQECEYLSSKWSDANSCTAFVITADYVFGRSSIPSTKSGTSLRPCTE